MSKNKSKRHFTKKPGIIMYPIFRFLTKVIGSICFKKKCIQNDCPYYLLELDWFTI